MSPALGRSAWSLDALGEGLAELARRTGLAREERNAPEAPPPVVAEDAHARQAWVDAALRALALDATRERPAAEDLTDALATLGPALLELPGAPPRFALVVELRGNSLVLLAPDARLRRVPLARVREELVALLSAEAGPAAPPEPEGGALDALLARAGLKGRERARARAAVLDARLAGRELPSWWRLARPPGRDARAHLADARLPRRAAGLVALHLASHGIFVLSWIFLGRGALLGRLDAGWLTAWALALASLVPLRLAEAWLQEKVAIDGGTLVRRWLLRGALRLEPDELRHLGAGSLLSRVLESEALQAFALLALFSGVAALVELPIAALALAASGAGPLPWLFAAWIGLALVLGARHARASRAWTRARLDVTHDLVERMVGHRTRIVQQAPERWHEGEDELLALYLERSRVLDRGTLLLQAVIAPGWLVVGLAGLAPLAFADERGLAIAIGIGALLLAQRALARLSAALTALAPLDATWRELGSTLRAAAREERAGLPELAAAAPAAVGEPLLAVRGLGHRHEGRARATFAQVELTLHAGERLRLEGPSGAGKSTFVAVLAGLRRASEGLVTLRGLDLSTWGADLWRRRVAAAPQLHENHVFPGTLAFNLLLGRRWPPEREDFEEAEAVCRELGLGPLLERMPAGLDQVVGETGWQLSHGEASRLFLARALLQDADLAILDESLAALDPENLLRALDCVERRARSALLVAHA